MHQIKITYDDSTNTVFVQAAPADMDEIRGLIERIDTTVSSAVNDLRIYHLKNALADELSNILIQAVSEGVVAPTTAARPPATTVSNMLQQLFLGTGGLGTGARPTGGAPTLGGGGLPGGGGFGGLPTTAGLGTTAAGAGNLPRQVFMIPGAGVAEGASLVQVG